MRILFLGDIFARPGRDAVKQHLKAIKEKLMPDVVIANVENAAHGFGVTPKIAEEILGFGVDMMTSGNHIWDQKDIIPYLEKNKTLLRPYNYPHKSPGKGVGVFRTRRGEDIVIINMMGRVFMDTLDDPFFAMDQLLSIYHLKRNNVGAIFLDFHAETSSEKMSMAHYLDGKITAVIGTHTHIPTADAQIFNKGTAFQSDAGMCGDYNSVIGVEPKSPIYKFTRKMPSEKFSPTTGEATLCAVFVETDTLTGLAKSIRPIRIGPRLIESL